MINNTDTLYPVTTSFKHPKPGQPNSAVRAGVVPAAGGPAVWMKTPGDPSNTYIARLEWAGNSREVVLQHLNRLQNTLSVLIGDAATGEVRTIFTDTDKAWVEIMDDFVWLDGGRSLLWLSERDGWQHAYAVRRDGGDAKLLTPGDYDVIERQRRRREGRLALRHGLARRRDETVPLSRPDGRKEQAGARRARRAGRRPPIRHLALGPLGFPLVFDAR